LVFVKDEEKVNVELRVCAMKKSAFTFTNTHTHQVHVLQPTTATAAAATTTKRKALSGASLDTHDSRNRISALRSSVEKFGTVRSAKRMSASTEYVVPSMVTLAGKPQL
jgi:hypothetical protein